MYSYVAYTAVVVAFLAFIESGNALQCWDCMSELHGPCADHFNTTNFHRVSLISNVQSNLPRLILCGNSGFGNVNSGYQRQACAKQVETDKRSGRTTYRRGCHSLTDGENVGTCPNRNSYGDVTVDFCEYCDTHNCNGAQGLQKSSFLIGLIPISLAMVLHK